MAYDHNEYTLDAELNYEKNKQREAVETLQSMALEMAKMAQADGSQPRVTGITVRFTDQGAYMTTTVKASRYFSTR